MMKKIFNVLSISLFSLFIFSACSNDNKDASTNPQENNNDAQISLTISAAVSLKDAMDVIQKNYKDEHPNITLDFNFGGSGSLQQQISQGAPVDLFFSAAEDKFDILVQEGHIEEEERIDLLGNELVLIVPKHDDAIKNFNDLTKEATHQISIGTPETVPAGKYAKESFKQMGIWEETEPKIVYAKDVRQVLSYVETGNVEAGIVYKTDANVSNQVDIVAVADSATHTPIIYPVGIIKASKQYDAAKDFYTYLQSKEALEVFVAYGFTIQ